MKEFGSLRGIGEHLLHLLTFGQVDRGRERLETFTQLVGNLVSLGSRDDGALACQFRVPDNTTQRIGITIRNNQMHAEVTNTETHAVEASDDLPAPISASHAEMTRLLLELCMAGRKNGASRGGRVNEGGADLANIDLRGATLAGANLTDSKISQKNRDWAAAQGAVVEGVRICLEE